MARNKAVISADPAALPGQILSIIGMSVVWAIWGWPFAIAFIVGAMIGSIRHENHQ